MTAPTGLLQRGEYSSDAKRRQLIVQQHHHTKFDPHGVYLDLRISANSNGRLFIRARDGGAPDLACSNDLVGITELTFLVERLRREQLKREAPEA